MGRRAKHVGWTSRVVYIGEVSESVFTAPDGAEYVRATPREVPDLRLECARGLPPLLLRLRVRSSKERRARRAARQAERRRFRRPAAAE